MADTDSHRPTIGELGEVATLKRIIPLLPESDRTILGPGDDCAVITVPDGRVPLTVDLMIEGPDFRVGLSTGYDVGWKACATNLSDVAAMGATPTALVVAVAAPPSTPVDFLEGISRGFADAAEALAPGCGVVGGDLSTAPVIMVSVTATGEFDGVNPVTRSGARVGHLVAVAGELGRARHGLDLLFERALSPEGVVDVDAVAELWRTHPAELSAQLRPAPPIFAGRVAALAGASSMMDISDGLVLDAARIAAASGVGIDFDLASVGSRIALTGGEDHSLLATFPLSATIPTEFRVIGRVVPTSGVSVDGVPFTAKGGWDPLRDG
ncbi:MAG: thiamine-phosphate kinase [Microbacteriaceae bacterium]